MRIGQISDLHYSPTFLTEADRCTASAIAQLLDGGMEILVDSGDAVDHELDAHSPALHALQKQMRAAADRVPVLMLQGTLSHDYPGTIRPFSLLGGRYPIFVSERIEQVAWTDAGWVASEGWCFDKLPDGAKVIFTCIPAVNRAEIAARVGAINASASTQDMVSELLAAYATSNEMARAAGIPTMLVSHGTVSGSVTEHGVPMAGLDHEFSTGALFSAMASAVALGHIHKHQTWTQGGRQIAYAGSIGRLHHGEQGDKGCILWDVQAAGATHAFLKTPSREMLEIAFNGPPDMEALAALAARSKDAHVRIRWTVDAEHHAIIDKKAINAMFAEAAAVKLEGHINPILRARTTGVTAAPTMLGKLEKWTEATATDATGLPDLLVQLQTQSAEQILNTLLSAGEEYAKAA